MSAVVVTQPPRALYAAATIAVAVIASACAFAVARAVGGPGSPAGLTAGLIGGVSIVGLLPVLANSAERFGLAVLGSSMARLLLSMFAAVILTEVGGMESRPIWLGIVAGAGFALLAESAIAITILTSIDRKQSGAQAAHPESSTTC